MQRTVEQRSARATRAEQMKELKQLEEEQQRRNLQRAMGFLRTRQQREADQEHLEPLIVFSRGRPPDRVRGSPEEPRLVVIVPEDLYSRFIRLVYLTAFIFIMIASGVSLAMSLFSINLDKETSVPFFTWLIPAIVLIVVVNCCPQLKRIFVLNWILAVFIMMLLALTMAYFWYSTPWLTLLLAMLITGAVLVVCYMIGAFIPTICLPGGPISSCLLLIVMILWLVFFFLMIFMNNPVYTLVFFVLGFFIAFVQMLIHAQFIHGRLPVIPLFTMPFCALTIFGFYFLTLVCIYIFYRYSVYRREGYWLNM